MEQAIFKAKPHKTILEDGSEIWALELPDGVGLYKFESLMVAVGKLDGWTVYHWLSDGAQLEAIKTSGYLGATWDELPEDAYKAVMETEVPGTDAEGNPTVTRMKLVEAEAAGIEYTEVFPPHEWEGVS